jgi:hypothetical protein
MNLMGLGWFPSTKPRQHEALVLSREVCDELTENIPGHSRLHPDNNRKNIWIS